jgi:hypothetical protein
MSEGKINFVIQFDSSLKKLTVCQIALFHLAFAKPIFFVVKAKLTLAIAVMTRCDDTL